MECDIIKQGDCLELMKEIPDNSIDMILCDLPYGITACKWDAVIPFELLWNQYNRIIKSNGIIALFGTQPFTTQIISSNKSKFKYCWYWLKNNTTGFVFAKHQPMRKVEEICIFINKRHPNNNGERATYNPQGLRKLEKPKKKVKCSAQVYDGSTLNKQCVQTLTGYPNNVLEVKNEASSNRNRLHPTQKPVELLEYLIKTYTNEGETVLDNCMGSGSTCVACINTNRQYIGYELEEKYFEIAKKRIQEAIAKKQE